MIDGIEGKIVKLKNDVDVRNINILTLKKLEPKWV